MSLDLTASILSSRGLRVSLDNHERGFLPTTAQMARFNMAIPRQPLYPTRIGYRDSSSLEFSGKSVHAVPYYTAENQSL